MTSLDCFGIIAPPNDLELFPITGDLIMSDKKNKSKKAGKAKKSDKAEKVESKTKAEKAPAAEKPKYGVAELAAVLGIKEASVRVRLRNAEIEKSGKSYGWDSEKAMKAVAKELKADPDK